ncbi:hypothetical protein HAX54_016721 [Datura stramonium]|uniref:Glutamyl-tRNA reductase n=1 Tax=Datura stramonium TaxID=4076 RepID=A0ABS8UJG1_DATST|nr:hypothetical protein [Datura stramonium]
MDDKEGSLALVESSSELFKHAITAGKRVRTETNISSGSVSVSSAAVELALLKLPEYSSSTARVLIVGAGKMGKLVIRHLVSKGCKKMVVVNRTEERVAAIREELTDADIIYKPFSEMLACAAQADMVGRLFIDISVPRNVELIAIIAEEVKQFEALKDSLETVPTIKKLRAYAERIRAAEVDKCLSKMGDDLPQNKKKAIYDLSLGIVNKLLHGPMQHPGNVMELKTGL